MRYYFCNNCKKWTSSDTIDWHGWKCGRCLYTLDPHLVVSVEADARGCIRCRTCPTIFSIYFADGPFCSKCRGARAPVSPSGARGGQLQLKRRFVSPSSTTTTVVPSLGSSSRGQGAIEVVHGSPIAFVPGDVLIIVLAHLDDPSLLNARVVSRLFHDLVRAAARQMAPFPSQARFLAATAAVFQDFRKQASTVTIGRREAFREGWRLYASIQVKASPAYLELFNEKYCLFNNQVRKQLGPAGQLLDPQLWTPEVNDAWILGHLHRNHPFRLLADPTFVANFWDAIQARPTALGREIWQIMQAGYEPVHARALGGVHGGCGILLMPPGGRRARPAILEDARGATDVDLRDRLRDVASPGFAPVQGTTGRKAWCPHSGCGNEVSLLWRKDPTDPQGKRWRAVYTCNRHGTV